MAKKARQRWDLYRWIAVWLGLLMPVAVLLYPVLFGVHLFGGEPTRGSVMVEVGVLVYPSMLSGAVSGARFFALYAGYVERDVPTAALSAEDAERGATAAYRPVKDWLWGSLVAALPAALVIAVQVAPTQESDTLGRIAFGVFVYLPIAVTVAMGWILGALIGTLVSVFLSSVLGIVVGLKQRQERRGRLTWILIAVFLLVLLIWAFGAFFILLAPGSSLLLWIDRISGWVGAVLFLVLVAIGTPALHARLRAARGE